MMRLIPAFRDATKGISGCGPDGRAIAYPLGDDEIVPRSSLVSGEGRRLVSLYVEPAHQDLLAACDGPPPAQWRDQLFFVDANGAVKLLGDGMRVLDAGDYDGDGSSDVVVKREVYDEDSYAMFSRSFSSAVIFAWHYH